MWKPIKNYEGYYEVNEYGVIRSVDRDIVMPDGTIHRRKSKIMSQSLDKDGYLTVKLSKDGKSKRYRVARIVAETFVDGYQEGFEPNHLDFNRTNNRVDNLKWASHADNVAYTKAAKRHVSDRNISGENNPNYNNHTLHQRFEDNPELRKLQSRPGSQNGRSKKIRMFVDNESIDFDYMGACAKYLIDNGYTKSKNVYGVATYIRIAAENGKKYLGIKFELI